MPNVMMEVRGISAECAVPSKVYLQFYLMLNSFQPDQGLARKGFLGDWGLAIDLSKVKRSEINESELYLRTVGGAFSCCVMFSEVWAGDLPLPFHGAHVWCGWARCQAQTM
jgi:hypothetical protein